MKTFLCALILVAAAQVQASPLNPSPYPDPRPTPQPAPQPVNPAHSLRGAWTLTSHLCSSGEWPHDNYQPQRDRLDATFTATRFTLINDFNGCSVWTEGPYQLDGHVLQMYAENSHSSCGAGNPPVSFSYALDWASRTSFVLRIGPMTDNGGVCPQGDLLENTFEKVDNQVQDH